MKISQSITLKLCSLIGPALGKLTNEQFLINTNFTKEKSCIQNVWINSSSLKPTELKPDFTYKIKASNYYYKLFTSRTFIISYPDTRKYPVDRFRNQKYYCYLKHRLMKKWCTVYVYGCNLHIIFWTCFLSSSDHCGTDVTFRCALWQWETQTWGDGIKQAQPTGH